MKIKNDLDQVGGSNHKIKAKVISEQEELIIMPGDEGYFNFSRPQGAFKLMIETFSIPSKKGIRGIQVASGSDIGEIDHFEVIQKGNQMKAILHYTEVIVSKNKEKGKIPGSDKQHVDPTVFHPDEPGGS